MYRRLVFVAMLLLLVSMSVQAQDRVVVRYWDYWVTQGPAMDEAIQMFEEAHPNIDIEKTTQGGGGYPELLNAAFQGGPDSTPDVFVLPTSGNSGLTVQQLVEQGWLLPISDFADFADFRATFPNPDFIFMDGTDNTIDGRTYSAKFNPDGVWIKMFINTRLYEEAGLVNDDGSLMLPVTLDDAIANSRVILETTGSYGFGMSGTQTWAQGWWMWMCERSTKLWSGPLVGLDWRTGEYDLAEDACAPVALERLAQIRDEGLFLPDSVALAIDDEGVRVKFAQHEFAHLIAGDWVIAGWEQTNPEFTEYTVIPLPLVGVDEPQGGFHYAPGGAWFGIAADTEHPAEAWEFFQFLHSAEFADIWARTGNGLTVNTPQPYSQYATSDAWAAIFDLHATALPGPSLALMNPDTTRVTATLQGPSLDDLVSGVFTGQITDIHAALVDLDTRSQAAFEQAIADAQAAGAQVTVEDFIVADWDPTVPYIIDMQ